MVKAKQPTIAIITAQYCEKLAVDAMIENQETFVRYTTVGRLFILSSYFVFLFLYLLRLCFLFVGESNVYTLGNMGSHRVVSTKLPSVGHTREAMIAAGNTTTRLLGNNQNFNFFHCNCVLKNKITHHLLSFICADIFLYIGTFQKVDYVFLIGVGGGVPHFTDYNKHVRLGDVVVSAPTNTQRYAYLISYVFIHW